VVAYVRARQSLWAAVGLLVGLILIVWNLWNLAPSYISKYPVVNDFRLAYSAATVGIKVGYSHLYDLAAQKTAIEQPGPRLQSSTVHLTAASCLAGDPSAGAAFHTSPW